MGENLASSVRCSDSDELSFSRMITWSGYALSSPSPTPRAAFLGELDKILSELR